jgi:hypothetical protein
VLASVMRALSPLSYRIGHDLHDRFWRRKGGHLQGMPERCFPPPRSGMLWLKGNAYEKSAPTHSQGTHQPDFSHGARASSFGVWRQICAGR